MNGRSLILCTVLGTIALFAWQTVSNVVFPWHEATIRPFADTSVVAAQAMRAQAPVNGVYFNPHGVVMAVSSTPDFADTTSQMGPMMGRQLVLNFIGVLILCYVVGRMGDAR